MLVTISLVLCGDGWIKAKEQRYILQQKNKEQCKHQRSNRKVTPFSYLYLGIEDQGWCGDDNKHTVLRKGRKNELFSVNWDSARGSNGRQSSCELSSKDWRECWGLEDIFPIITLPPSRVTCMLPGLVERASCSWHTSSRRENLNRLLDLHTVKNILLRPPFKSCQSLLLRDTIEIQDIHLVDENSNCP